jgi:hypothetical protein
MPLSRPPLHEPVDRRRLGHGTGDQARRDSASVRRARAHLRELDRERAAGRDVIRKTTFVKE